jgi:hypothetical protein
MKGSGVESYTDLYNTTNEMAVCITYSTGVLYRENGR